MDLTDPDACLNYALSYDLTPRIDILINNAGISQRDEFVNTDFSVLKKMMNVNTISPIALIKGFMPLFLNNREA